MNKNLIEIHQNGYTRFPAFFDEETMIKAGEAIIKSYEVCRNIQVKNGISEVTDGTVHHLLDSSDTIYLELLEKICQSEVYAFIKDFFQGNFILNTYGGVINLTSKPSYVANVHRDIRFFSGDLPLMMNLLIMLDDFTLENGATYLLDGSHKFGEKPSDESFYAQATRATGKRGDIIFFNSNLWHAAGLNTTEQTRKAITINFSKPFMKQQMDYPRLVGENRMSNLNHELKQMLGYFSRTPTNLDEWYQKPENRFYRPDQM